MVLTEQEKQTLKELRKKEKKSKKRPKGFSLKTIDPTKLTPSERKLFIRAEIQVKRTRDVTPKLTTSQKLRQLIARERSKERRRKVFIKTEQFRGGIPIGLRAREIQARRIIAIPGTPPPSRIINRRRFIPEPLQKNIINEDILSSERAARDDFTKEDVLGSENMFGTEDFRGREDFTSIS